ncbi:hypothetical protein CERZMDRAFT_94469 [Cercospora zeae-maydis SCOH1-5]|uniref:ABM domain-containing protein n=1 Tax=Cercospora zeae-maydis SCOH1-5 TaxID=717836 RepID=A0A6A6FRP3_9PEZI|nr:hypothetical protein CERZMDRAFT_94469 [Cercospora zeae-maydis SCOH1-5]
MPITEIADFRVKDGITTEAMFDRSSSDFASLMQEWTRAMHRHKGFHTARLGTKVEDESNLIILIDWDDVQSHFACLSSPDYAPIAERIVTDVAPFGGTMCHVALEPYEDVQKAAKCPITAITFFHFEDDPPEDFLERARAFRESAMKEPGPKPLAAAYGITHEEVEDEDTAGKAVVLVAGWESMEAHDAFRASETFQKCMPELVVGVKKSESYRVPLRIVEASMWENPV